MSFYDWCIESDNRVFLDRWDYELNNHTPREVSYKSDKKIYFKCPVEKHKSRDVRLRWISELDTKCDCVECKLEMGSFGKWCEDNSPSILELWDGDANQISPYDVLFASNKKYFLNALVRYTKVTSSC